MSDDHAAIVEMDRLTRPQQQLFVAIHRGSGFVYGQQLRSAHRLESLKLIERVPFTAMWKLTGKGQEMIRNGRA